MTPDELHDRLSTLADPACKAFGDSLQPGVTDRLGVRMPLVRRVARDVMRTEDVRAFLNAMLAAGGFASQEALMVCVIVAGGAKALELEERLAFVDRLLPHMTGWATCDLTGSAVKVFRENREELIGYVGEKLASDDPWTVRVAEVWLLEHYRDARWTLAARGVVGGGPWRALGLAASGGDYLAVAVGGCLSVLATADLEAVCSRIESWRAEGRLDDATLRRTVRKIRESLQFTKETKAAVSARFAAR